MGTEICLGYNNKWRANNDVINAYHDYKSMKEGVYNSDDADVEADPQYERNIEWTDDENGRAVCEQWYFDLSQKTGVDFKIFENSDLEGAGSQPIIRGSDIKKFIDKLREGIRQAQKVDDGTDWEETIELQHIALCEFALEHGFGIRLSV